MNSVVSFRGVVAAAAIAAMSMSTTAVAQEKQDQAKSPAKKPVARAVASPSKVRPMSVNIDLLNKARISGTLTDSTTLEMRTAFGVANIPLSEVAGIRFASADNASTTVVMLNGDSITGATDIKMMTVETEWGSATINGPNIASVLFVPGLVWNPQNGLNGKRWNLATVKTPTTPAPPSGATGSATPTRSSNGRTQYPSNSSQPVFRGR